MLYRDLNETSSGKVVCINSRWLYQARVIGVLVHFGALKITKLAQIKTANFDAFAFMMMLGMRVFGQIRLKWQQSEHKPE